MRKLILFFAIFICGYVNAQLATQWQQVYGGPGVETGYSVKTCLGQGYIVAGTSSSSGPTDGYVVRTDTVGLVMWAKFYGGVNIDVIRSIKILPDSGFILAGYTNSFGNGGYDGWVLRLDKNGDTLWTKFVGTPNWDFFYDVATTWDSGFVFAGGTYGLGNGEEDLWMVKLDSAGDVVWSQTYGGAKEDEARGIVETQDSLLVCVGYTKSLGDTLGDSWILRVDATTGDTLWARKGLHTVGADKALAVASGTGRFGVVGQYTTSTGDQNAFIHTMLLDSTTQLNITNGISGYEYFSSIVFLPTSYNLATLGSTENDGGGNGDFFLFHDIDYSSHTYGTQMEEFGYGIDATPGKGYITCGYTTGYNSNVPNLYLVKIDSTGQSTQIVDVHEPLQGANSLTTFPNPADHSVTFSMESDVPSFQPVLYIYDLTGQVIFSSQESWSQNGNIYTYQFQTSELAAGLYYYNVRSKDGQTVNGQLIIVH